MNVTVQHNIANLNGALALYQQLRGLTNKEVLEKQGGKLARAMAGALKQVRASKEQIYAEAIAQLKSGRGIRVRQSVKEQVEAKWGAKWAKRVKAYEKNYWGDTLNQGFSKQQEMVRREIAVRRSGAGFLAVTARYPTTLAQGQKALGRFGLTLSMVNLRTDGDSPFARFSWGEFSKMSKRAGQAFLDTKGGAVPVKAIQAALDAVTDDILLYTNRKQQELAQKLGKSLVAGKLKGVSI